MTWKKIAVRILIVPAMAVLGILLSTVPAWADDASDCNPSDAPDHAGNGLAGLIDDQAAPSTGGSPTLYEQYGWSGLSWSTCNLADPSKAPGAVSWIPGVDATVDMFNERPDMTKNFWAWADTSVGNLGMGGSRTLGATMTQLDQWVGDPGSLMKPIDDSLDSASSAVTTALWGTGGAIGIGSVVIVVAVCFIIWWARSGDVRRAGRTMVAICLAALAMGALGATWQTSTGPHSGAVALGQMFDHAASGIVGSVNSSLINSPDTPPNTAYGATLYDKILVPIWIQGAVGTDAGDINDPSSLAYAIWHANTSPWGADQDTSAYQTVAKCLTGEESCTNIPANSAQYHQLQGVSKGRSGLGIMAFMTMGLIAIIRIPCSILTMMGLVVIRFVVMFIPVWAIFAVIEATRPTATGAGKMVLAAVYNMAVFGIFGALHTGITGAIIGNDKFTFGKLVLIGVLTAVTWVVSKPFRSVTIPATGDLIGGVGQETRQVGRRLTSPFRAAARFGTMYAANRLATRDAIRDDGGGADQPPPSAPSDTLTTTYQVASTEPEPIKDIKPTFQVPVTNVQAPVKLQPVVEWEDMGGGQMKPHLQSPIAFQKPFEVQSPITFQDRNYVPPTEPTISWTPPGGADEKPLWEDRERWRQPQPLWTGPSSTTGGTVIEDRPIYA